MITCKECNFEILQIQDTCPRCRRKISFSQSEIRELEGLLDMSRKNREYEAVAEYLRILAGAGITDYERDWGAALEKGDITVRNYESAMDYFLRAAKKHDAYSAYRYSRLAARLNERSGRFWLLYSAFLSCAEAYPAAARELSRSGNEDGANYFYSLAAAHDDVDSIVEMASRYFKGELIQGSSENAKWYMDKLSFPPLYALKLAYKLRGVSPTAPSEVKFDKTAFIRALADEAMKCGFAEAYYKLEATLADMGDIDAMTLTAILLANGDGCRADMPSAIRLFNEAAAGGSAEAYLCLGKIYLSQEGTPRDTALAAQCLEEAGKLGLSEAYDALGDVFAAGDGVPRDYKKAEDFYRRAALGGTPGAGEKADKIVRERDEIYKKAIALTGENPKSAFRGLAIAAAMGHRSAPRRLADCYLKGLGTQRSNSAAYYWYRTAAEGGDEKALYPLGLCLSAGIGTARDYDAAIAVLKSAAELGSEGAHLQIKTLLERKKKKLTRRLYSAAMRLVYQKKYEAARDMLTLAAELGEEKSYYTIGCMYEFGLGSPTDRISANKFYEKSAMLGYFDDKSRYKKAILKLIRKQ